MTATRITNMMVSNQIVAEVTNAENTMDNTEEELSSGLRINQPSDDPAGAGLAVQLNGQLSDLTTYSNNISDANGWTSTTSTALSTIDQDTQRIYELVVEAGNGTNSADDLQNISDEIGQLQTSISTQMASTYNGQSVFTGTGSGGSSTAVTRTISPGTTVTVNADLSSVTDPSDGSSGLMSTINRVMSDLTGSGDSGNLNGSDLSALQNNLSQLSSVQTQVGATQDQITMASSSIEQLQTTTTTELGDDTNVNMASAETDYSNEEAAFEAALKAGADIVQESLMSFLQN
jgi:flagellar hook-associated protein 3 FlgL